MTLNSRDLKDGAVSGFKDCFKVAVYIIVFIKNHYKSTKHICITLKIPKCSIFPTQSPELNEDGSGITPEKLHQERHWR